MAEDGTDRVREAWRGFADELAGMVEELRSRYRDAGGEASDASFDRASSTMRSSLDDASRRLRETVRDPAVRGEAGDVGGSFLDALGTTFTEVGQKLRDAASEERRRSSGW